MSNTRELLLKAAAVHEQIAASLRQDASAIRSPNGDVDPMSRALAIHPKMGDRQRQVLQLVIEAGEKGTDMGTVQRAIGDITGPNVHLTLKRLVELGFVRKEEHLRPQLYYVADPLK
jgi:hypothetical protein